MKTEKLTRLISALGKSSPYVQQKPQVQREQRALNTDAVKIALTGKTEGLVDERSQKVSTLKARVEAGSYKPDSTEVAKAFVKELGLY